MIFSSVNRLFFILVLLLLSENFQSYLVDFIGGTSERVDGIQRTLVGGYRESNCVADASVDFEHQFVSSRRQILGQSGIDLV